MMADEQPSQAGAAGDRDPAEGAEEPTMDVKAGPDDRPDTTQDPAEGAADLSG